MALIMNTRNFGDLEVGSEFTVVVDRGTAINPNHRFVKVSSQYAELYSRKHGKLLRVESLGRSRKVITESPIWKES